jgi:DnaK suppressor protein
VKTPTKTKLQAKAAPAKKPAAAKSTVAVKPEPKAKAPAAKSAAAKSPVKVAAKSPPKVVAKLAKPVVAQPVKTEASKATPKAATKAVTKASASSPPSRTAAPQPLKAAPVPKTDQASPAKSMSVTPVEPVKSPVEQTPASTSPAPEQLVRATRPSARLAQITVPSLPPAVASTAAKSSFMPSATPAVAAMAFTPIKKDPKLANNWKSKKVHELSDAEILAMSDDNYMNETQMAYFRLKLSVLKQEILASAGLTTEHLREDTVVVPDPADRATIEEEHALELRTRDRERKLLKKIEQSIQRIDVGDYGYCDETGEAIGVGRLLARPTATLSLEAQQRRELKQKMFGD